MRYPVVDKVVKNFNRRNHMDREGIVAQLLDRCNSMINNLLDDPALGSMPAASLALFEKFRDVCREILQSWVDERFAALSVSRPERCPCGGEGPGYVHRRSVTANTLFGGVVLPFRTFQCEACQSYLRPDDTTMGIPDPGTFSDDVRALFEPLAAELPHRTAADLFQRCTGVDLSSRGAQSVIDSTADDLRAWREDREAGEVFQVSCVLAKGDDLVLEVAMDGVMAHIDGAWHEAKVGPSSSAVAERRPPKANRSSAPSSPGATRAFAEVPTISRTRS
jgi:hypothetical protein